MLCTGSYCSHRDVLLSTPGWYAGSAPRMIKPLLPRHVRADVSRRFAVRRVELQGETHGRNERGEGRGGEEGSGCASSLGYLEVPVQQHPEDDVQAWLARCGLGRDSRWR